MKKKRGQKPIDSNPDAESLRALSRALGANDEMPFITELMRAPERHIRNARNADLATVYRSRGDWTLALVPGDLYQRQAVAALFWREAIALDPDLERRVAESSPVLRRIPGVNQSSD